MWRLIVRALGARRGQSYLLFALAALAVAVSTAVPLYADAADRAARLDEAAHAVHERRPGPAGRPCRDDHGTR